MDTNSNIPDEKKIVSVEILHLDELGYGPQGKHTRREWRAECLENLRAGKERFEAWQAGWKHLVKQDLNGVSLAVKLIYEDDSEKLFLANKHSDGVVPYAFDLMANTFDEVLEANSLSFEYAAYFNYSIFKRDVNFSASNFKQAAVFSDAMFLEAADFSYSLFEGDAIFDDVDFLNVAVFRQSTFCLNGIFSNSKFTMNVYFNNVLFLKNAYFPRAHFNNTAYFYNSKFSQHAVFEYAKFLNVGYFTHAVFLKKIPDFLGCDVKLTRLEFSDESHFSLNLSEADIRNAHFLSIMSGENGQKKQALEFKAIRLHGIRKQSTTPIVDKMYIFLDEKITDFRRSVVRPIVLYLCITNITFISALSYGIFNSNEKCNINFYSTEFNQALKKLTLA